MEERIDRLENLMAASVQLSEIMLRNQDQMRQNYRHIQENNRRNEENNRRNEENWQRIEENNRLMEESQEEIRDLLQRLTQAVAVMQAEIVRIDETHS